MRLQRASENDLLLIHGSSGCGKSSLVRAGLLPILTEYTLYGNKSLWDYQIIEFKTKKSTWQEQLRQSLNEKLDTDIEESNDPEIADSEIEEWLKAAADMNGQPRKQFGMIFFFDQLESFFTNENESQQRQLFDKFLVRLSRLENIIVISSLRSDFLPSLDSLPQVKEITKSQGLLQLFPPSEYELNEIIRYPAIAAGLSFEDDPETGNGLEQSLCREAINSPEGLPLLEFLLTELYDGVTEEGMITWEKYKSLGGIAGALSQRAEMTLNELPEECQKALPLVILKLMSYTRERNIIRNWMPLDEAYDNILYRQVIDHFVANRLFTVSRLNESSVVSVSHESLIRSWPRIKKLAQEHENFLVFKSNLELPLRTWEKSLAQEKKEHLLTGSLLREGTKLMAKFPDFFTRREKEFLQESMLDKGKKDVIRNRQRLKYAKTLSIISLLTVVITVVFIIILLKQRERETQNNLIIKDLSSQRDKLNSDIQSHKDELLKINEELTLLSQQKVLLDQKTKMTRTDQQINMLASRLRKGNVSYVQAMKVLENISPELRGWEWGYLYLKSLPDYQPLLGHREAIASIQLSTDEDYLITASWDDTAKIWDASSGKLLSSLKHKSKGISDVEYAIFSEDSTKAITASSDGFIRIWKVDFNNSSPEPLITFKAASKPIRFLDFTPDGKFLVSCDDTGSIKFWDWAGSNFASPVSTYTHLKDLRCSKVIFSKDSLKMISIGWTQTPKLWNYTGNGRLISTPDFSKKDTHKDIIRDACFISDNEIVTVSKDKSMIIWNLETGTKWRGFFHKSDVMATTYLPSLNLIATASKDRSIVLIEPYSENPHKTIKVHTNTINSLTTLKDTPKLFAVSSDYTGSIHTISDDQSATNHIQKDYVFQGLKAYSIANDSQEVFVLDESGSIHTIFPNGSMSDDPLESNYPLTNHKVLSFKYVKDYDFYIIVLSNGIIIELNKNNRTMRPLEILPRKAEISPDGTSTALLSTDNKLYLYKSISDSPALQPLLPEQSFTNVCWLSPNKLLLVDSNHIIYEYSLASFTLDELFHSGHNKNIFRIHAQMTAEGPACITSSSDNKVTIQYLNTMNRIEFSGGTRNDISSYSLSPDAKRLISISKNDTTPYLWNAVNGEELFPLTSLFSPLIDCSFSPDGSFIVVTDQNDTLRIFFSTSSSIPLPE
ncbi:MAG: hypothetical protein MK132_02180 [Lentisphaerales bacterium]|nr:hypothetical protein [Lentisphaerales bacterium]